MEFAHAPWEEGVTRDAGQDLGRGPAEGGVAGHVPGERRGHEAGTLVGPPVLGKDPAHAGDVAGGVDGDVQAIVGLIGVDVVRSLPREDLDLADVLTTGSGQVVRVVHELDEARVEWNAVGAVAGQGRVGGLSLVGHVADGRNGTGVVVVALDAPRGNGGVVDGTAQCEVGFHLVLQGVEFIAFSHPVAGEVRVGHDLVEDAEPVTRGGLAVRAIRPEFREDAGVVPEGHHLLLVGQSSVRIEVVSDAGVSAVEIGVEVPVVGDVLGEGLHVADGGGARVNHHPVVGIVVRLPDAHHCEMVLVHAVLGKGLVSPGVDRRAGIEVGGPDLPGRRGPR